MKKYYILKGVKYGIFFFGMVALGSWVTMLLWNWLIPAVFGLGTITWIQALGLLALSRILFGNWGGRRGHHRKRKGYYTKEMWKKRWQERMEKMSPEERERWKAKFGRRGGGRCGWTDDTFKDLGNSHHSGNPDKGQDYSNKDVDPFSRDSSNSGGEQEPDNPGDHDTMAG